MQVDINLTTPELEPEIEENKDNSSILIPESKSNSSPRPRKLHKKHLPYLSQKTINTLNASAEAASPLPDELKPHYPSDMVASNKVEQIHQNGYKGVTLGTATQTILNLDMAGKKGYQIAQILGFHPTTISNAQKSGLYIAAKRLRLATINKTVDEQLTGLSIQALDNIKEELYRSKDPARRLKASIWILEEQGHSPIKKSHLTVDVGELTKVAFQQALEGRQKRKALEAADNPEKQKEFDLEIEDLHLGDVSPQQDIELSPNYEEREQIDSFFEDELEEDLTQEDDAGFSLEEMMRELNVEAEREINMEIIKT